MQPRVGDRGAGGAGQRGDQLLVLGGELTVGAVGEVEVSEHLTVHPDRDTEEGGHRRVLVREAGGVGMGAQVGQPDRPRATNQGAEEPLTGRQVADPVHLVGVHADMDELFQPAVRSDDAERAVPGAHQIRGRPARRAGAPPAGSTRRRPPRSPAAAHAAGPARPARPAPGRSTARSTRPAPTAGHRERSGQDPLRRAPLPSCSVPGDRAPAPCRSSQPPSQPETPAGTGDVGPGDGASATADALAAHQIPDPTYERLQNTPPRVRG